MKTLALAIASAALLVGCGQPDPEALDRRGEALFYAAPSAPEDDAVVKLRALKNDGDTLFCTATLIAPKLALTAMHCVATVTDNANCMADGELAPGSVEGVFGEPFVPSNITFHVGAGEDEPVVAQGEKIFTTGAVAVCKDDLAVVALDRELTGVPLAALRLGLGNQRGEAIRVVGYGRAEDDSTGVRKTRDDLKIQLLGKSAYSDSNDSLPPNTFATIGPSVCNGDSGGPVFTPKNAVTGVVSHGASCTSATARHIFTQVAPYEELLLRPAFEYVGYAPILEAGDDGGAGGQNGEGDESAGAGAAAGAVANNAAGHGVIDDTVVGPPEKGGCTCGLTASAASRPARLLSLALVGAIGARRRRRRVNAG